MAAVAEASRYTITKMRFTRMRQPPSSRSLFLLLTDINTTFTNTTQSTTTIETAFLESHGALQRADLMRSRSQWMPPPPVNPGLLRLAVNDANPIVPAVKTADTIFPTEKPNPPKQWGVEIIRAMNMTFLLNGKVTDDNLRKFVGDMPEDQFQNLKAGKAKPHIASNLQNPMFGTGKRTWIQASVSAEVQLEDLKVVTFNLSRESSIHRLRYVNRTDAYHAECLVQSQNCRNLSDRLLADAIAVYKPEITDISTGVKSPFRYKERTLSSGEAGIATRQAIVDLEVSRLQAIVNELTDYPPSCSPPSTASKTSMPSLSRHSSRPRKPRMAIAPQRIAETSG